MRIQALALVFTAVSLLGAPAQATTYYVRPGGSDSACSGTVDADSTGGSSCAWKTIDKCDTTLTAGDTCQVAAGVYGQLLNASNSGTSDLNRIVYSCPSRNCVVKVSNGDTLDLRNKSWITVDGFIFEDGQLEPWGGSSTGILLDNIVTRDTDNKAPYAAIFTGGGTDNMLRNFSLTIPYDASAKPNVANIGVNASSSELRTVLKDGTMRGSWNNLALKSCKDCVLDGVKLTGAKNHTLDLANGGTGVTNLTFQNCVIMASTGFRENNPQTLGNVNGLNVMNCAILSGYLLPSIGHETQLSGTVRIRNNIFFNAGTGSGEFVGEVNNDSPVSWDIDYNAYVGAGNFSSPTWKDTRGSTAKDYYADIDQNGVVDNAGNSDFDDWQALGFDQHSIVIANTDFRSSSASYASPLWGPNGPYWGAMVDCGVDTNSFETQDQWAEGIAVGDTIEYEWDGIQRTVTGVSNGTGGGTCSARIDFTPSLPSTPKVADWFLSWGRTPGLGKSYAPVAGSKVIDAGDNASCAHPINGSRCDMGPVEYGAVSSDTQKPTAPTGLTATPGTGTVDLSWSPSTDNIGVIGYDVMRSTTPGSGHVYIGQSSGTSFFDTSGAAGTAYYYIVQAYDAAGNRSNPSNEASATHPGGGGGGGGDTQPPTIPGNVQAIAGDGQVTVTWSKSTDNVGVDGYLVARGSTSGGPYYQVGSTTTALTWTDSTVTNGTTYFYAVRARDAAGNVSGVSNEASATPTAGSVPDTTPPSKPTGVSATAGDGQVSLSWTASTDNVGVTGYDVSRSTKSGSGFSVIGTAPGTGYTDTGVTNGTKYYYTVRAKDAAGNQSNASAEVSATPNGPIGPDTTPPSTPNGLLATGLDAGVGLTWNASTDNSGFVAYEVFRSTAPTSGFIRLDSAATPSYTDGSAQTGTTYYYYVEALDAAGNRSGQSNVATATAGPLTIVSTTPTGGDPSVNCGIDPVIRFSEGLAANSVSSKSFHLIHVLSGKKVALASGSPRLEADGVTVTLIPQFPLYRGVLYRVEVLAGKKAPETNGGKALGAPYAFDFTTSRTAVCNPAPFEVDSSTPQDQQGGVNTGSAMWFTFLSQADPATISAKKIKLIGPTGSKVKLASEVSISPDGMSLGAKPLSPLATSSSYTLTLKGGKKGVKGKTGQPLPDTFTLTFTTSNVSALSQMELGVSD